VLQGTRVIPKNSSGVLTADVPVIEVDRGGEVITGFIVADDYVEFSVNGKLVFVDSIPVNSTIVKFRARRPITYAFLIVDWEEDLGLRTEWLRPPSAVTAVTSTEPGQLPSPLPGA
jgi:hypothetical protein